MVRRARVDAELVRRGLARSRQQAAQLIDEGRVQIDGMPAAKAATAVAVTAALTVEDRLVEVDYGEYDGLPFAELPSDLVRRWRTEAVP